MTNFLRTIHFSLVVFILCAIVTGCNNAPDSTNGSNVTNDRIVWSKEKAWEWFDRQEWPVGANFTPSTAINQIEFWQEETYDSLTIDRELGWASEIGFNTMRVYLHYLVWARNPAGLKDRIDNFLTISEKHGIRIMFVLFDDCWNDEPNLGKQPNPQFGVHNSGWAQCPGGSRVDDKSLFPVLEAYTKDVISHFAQDKRVLMWDLYNEPGNFDILERSLPLLKNVISWAREASPTQPITIGLWNWGDEFDAFNEVQAENSDVITFHHYDEADHLINKISEFKKFERPMICTEYMARSRNNTFQSHLPVFKEYNIGAINWGLVSGKTNTIYMWDSVYSAEPDIWFHDVLRPDGRPFDENEVALIKKLTAQ